MKFKPLTLPVGKKNQQGQKSGSTMLTQVLIGLRQTPGCVSRQLRRNIGVSAPASAKAAANLDPIQKLFHDKLTEYTTKSKKAGGGLVDSTPALEKQLTEELAKVDRMYGGVGQDMTKFPTFSFSDPTLERVDVGINQAEAQAELKAKRAETASELDKPEDLSDTPWFMIQ